jgi:hypothetical protein
LWLFSGAPEDLEDETVMETQGADALYSAVNILIHAIRTEDQDAQQNAAHRMIQIAKPCTIRRWSESNLGNVKPLDRIPKEIVHLVDLKWTGDEQAKLESIVEGFTSQGTSGA